MAILAAILAIGYPVAFDASADDRLTRGFTSMTMMSSVSGLTENWMLHPPANCPIPLMTRIDRSRIFW